MQLFETKPERYERENANEQS
ncbi:hypothetical protein PENARI_c002G08638 [Penicillium arizonense]|uniref:Uncharacterized protein n=1 Tax=Penicillium arizonense TaxID=1835702 RepID=A0A1F5LW96_PENAI|nr:hypothetical protein PENARI_c002G08638 [Penicillium arizonense]